MAPSYRALWRQERARDFLHSLYPGRDCNEREDDVHNPMATAMDHDPQASATAQVLLYSVCRAPPAAARSMIVSPGLWPCSSSVRMKQRSFSVTPYSNYPPSPCMRHRMDRPTGAVRPIWRDAARMSPHVRRHAVSFTRRGCEATAVPPDHTGGLMLYPA